MGIQNTKSFQKFIESQEISADKEKDIEQMIGAFSEYLVAVNPEYAYNKTYLSAKPNPNYTHLYTYSCSSSQFLQFILK